MLVFCGEDGCRFVGAVVAAAVGLFSAAAVAFVATVYTYLASVVHPVGFPSCNDGDRSNHISTCTGRHKQPGGG